VLSVVTAVLSNVVSNVPAVLMLKPFVDALKDHDVAWQAAPRRVMRLGTEHVVNRISGGLVAVENAAAVWFSKTVDLSGELWSEWQDLNLRALRPERNEHLLSY
jgi:hypothetical protein